MPSLTKRRHGNTMHGLHRTPIYNCYHNMLQRCYNPSHPNYNRYGERGVTVCERWQGAGGFNNFVDDMGDKPIGLTLERIDNNGDYEPSNCAWVTRATQALNRCNVTQSPNITYRPRKTDDKHWQVMIRRKSRMFYSRSFSSLEDALTVRDIVTEIRNSGGVDIITYAAPRAKKSKKYREGL